MEKAYRKQITLMLLLSILFSLNVTYASSEIAGTHIYSKKTIACGNGFSAVIKNDGTVWYWGRDIEKVEEGPTGDCKTKGLKKLESLTGVVAIAAGGFDNLLALKSNGTVWKYSKGVIKQVNGLTDIIDIAVSINHCLALKKDGSVWAWGNNSYGALGDGTTANRDDPLPVKDFCNAKSISVDAERSIVLKNDGTVWLFGTIRIPRYDLAGEIKYDSMSQYTPKKIEGMADIIDISTNTGSPVSNMHILALKNDGTVWSWGNNQYGQVDGESKELFYTESRRVDCINNIVSIADGLTECFAIEKDGALWSWGRKLKKVEKIQTTAKLMAVYAGAYHYISLDKHGKVWSWGKNDTYGALGNDDFTESKAPILSKVNVPIDMAYENEIKVDLDGRLLVFDVEPKIINGRTLVPIRSISEALNLNINWDQNTRTVSIKDAKKQIILKIDDTACSVNGSSTIIDAPPVIIKGRTFVPLRFISNIIGYNIKWDSDTRTISITK